MLFSGNDIQGENFVIEESVLKTPEAEFFKKIHVRGGDDYSVLQRNIFLLYRKEKQFPIQLVKN